MDHPANFYMTVERDHSDCLLYGPFCELAVLAGPSRRERARNRCFGCARDARASKSIISSRQPAMTRQKRIAIAMTRQKRVIALATRQKRYLHFLHVVVSCCCLTNLLTPYTLQVLPYSLLVYTVTRFW